ncbi:MAG: DUF1826 domain-containing protein [Pseudobdellovibrionaceae bacterium]|nr:DUF1826 domain-containing protein [Pseudobdellovibrionaceae bacterium]
MPEVLVTDGVREVPRNLPSQLALAWNTSDVTQIEASGKNLLVYFWQPSAAFGLALAEAKLAGMLPEMREKFSLEGIHHYFARDHGLLLNTLFMELKPCIDFIIQSGFGREFQLTLARPADQMCPIFHVDKVSLRLIVTLHGPGTEWLANQDVDRKRLGKGSNRRVVREGALIQQLKTFQVGILKGEEYPGNFGNGLVHRSPEPEPGAGPRWIFRLDSFRKSGRR